VQAAPVRVHAEPEPHVRTSVLGYHLAGGVGDVLDPGIGEVILAVCVLEISLGAGPLEPVLRVDLRAEAANAGSLTAVCCFTS
jgi:hypothetical protein